MGNDIYGDLESLGILKNGVSPKKLEKYDWLTQDELHLLLRIRTAGEQGLHKKETVKVEKALPGSLMRLDMAGMICWERDLNGRPMFVVATWKGNDFCDDLMRRERAKNHAEAFRPSETPLAILPAKPLE